MAWRPTRRITGHFRDESFQAVDCTGTDNQKQENLLHTPETEKLPGRGEPLVIFRLPAVLFLSTLGELFYLQQFVCFKNKIDFSWIGANPSVLGQSVAQGLDLCLAHRGPTGKTNPWKI